MLRAHLLRAPLSFPAERSEGKGIQVVITETVLMPGFPSRALPAAQAMLAGNDICDLISSCFDRLSMRALRFLTLSLSKGEGSPVLSHLQQITTL